MFFFVLDARHAAAGAHRPADGLRLEVAGASIALLNIFVTAGAILVVQADGQDAVRTDRVPGLGIAKGIVFDASRGVPAQGDRSSTRRSVSEISPHHRGRLLLLYDEAGTLKCETCFQCAAACPIEIIDMGGVDTKDRYHVHWGPPEQYAERREESALRRSGRPVPDRTFDAFAAASTSAPLDAHPRATRTTTRARLLTHPGADPGRLRTPAGRRAPAHQPLDRRLVQRDLRHRHQSTRTCASSRRRPRRSACAAAPTCTLLGGGRVLDALVEHLGTDVGGVSPDGAVRFEAADCGGEAAATPLRDASTAAAAAA